MTAQAAQAAKPGSPPKDAPSRSDIAVLVAAFLIALAVNIGCLLWANRTGFLLVPVTYLALGAWVIKKGV